MVLTVSKYKLGSYKLSCTIRDLGVLGDGRRESCAAVSSAEGCL